MKRAPVALAIAATAAAAVALPAATGAQSTLPTKATLTGTLSPAITDFITKPKSLALSVEAKFDTDPPGGQPATLQKAVISFSHGAAVNGRLFASCTKATLESKGSSGCPRASRVGTGHAVGVAAGLRENVNVTAFNGPRGRSILFWLSAESPVRIASAIDAPLKPVKTRLYAYQLTLNVPPNLQQIAGVNIAVTDFQTTVKANVKTRSGRRGYVEAFACPPGAQVPLRGDFTFVGGATQAVVSSIACGP